MACDVTPFPLAGLIVCLADGGCKSAIRQIAGPTGHQLSGPMET